MTHVKKDKGVGGEVQRVAGELGDALNMFFVAPLGSPFMKRYVVQNKKEQPSALLTMLRSR